MSAAFYNQGLLAQGQMSTEGLRLAQIVYNYLMLRSLPENSQFHPNILGQQALTNHKIESYCVTSVII